jgi:hypothetical protein
VESARLVLLAAGALAALHTFVPAFALLALVAGFTGLQAWLLRAGISQGQQPQKAATA